MELGAGLGLPAMVAALRGARAIATDGEEAVMPLLRRNCEAERFPEAAHPARTRPRTTRVAAWRLLRVYDCLAGRSFFRP